MRRFVILPCSLMLAGAAWAEGPVEPAVEPAAPVVAAVADAEDKAGEVRAVPGLLPAAAVGAARGLDVLSRSRLDMMMPSGRSHRGVHYPMYRPVATDRAVLDPVLGGVAGVTAPLESLFESELMTRLDEDHVQFDRAQWVQYDETPAADGSAVASMKLEIERGVYDLKNEILMTSQPVRIENRQFVIEGDTMLHDRASGLTRLTGRVRMTFYQEEPAASVTAAAPLTPAAAPTPAGVKAGAVKPAASPAPQALPPR